MSPKVVNMHHPEVIERVNHVGGDPTLAIIDRTTRWGNPKHLTAGRDRAEVIAWHREWILEQVKDPLVMALLVEELRGKDLACWCAPRLCHGDILLELANETMPERDGRPDSTWEMLLVVAEFLDLGDRLAGAVARNLGKPISTGDEIQRDLRRIAYGLKADPELDARVYALLDLSREGR